MNLKEWHKIVCEKAGYVCANCGMNYAPECYFQEDNNGRINQMVCGHHIKSQKAHPELKYDVDNGECLCRHCHNKTHN